jgi:hypothetical protein
MVKVTLIFGEQPFEISQLSLRRSCDRPALFGVSLYRVMSSVPASVFQSFIEALNGADIKITSDHLVPRIP